MNAKGVLAPNVRPYVMKLKLTVSRLNSGAFGTDFKTAYAVKESSTTASRRSPSIRPEVQPTAAIKSICEPKMIVAKKLVTRRCRANSHRQKDNVKMIKQTDRHAG
ncbi:MAG: hypothetical protein Q4C21_04635 [Oscillospiraceae bacterium]|nr:hypothetical protein [Oscillospiraceae bacterium]